MNEQQNLEVVRRGYEAFGRADIEALLRLFDEHIEWVSPGPAELATSGRRRGRQAVADFFNSVNDVFEIQRFEPKEFIAQGDRVIVLGDNTSRIKATGAVLDSEWVHVFTVKNATITAFHEYADTAAVVAELHAAQAKV